MLTNDLIKPFLRPYGRALTVDQLDENSPLWLQTAQELQALLHRYLGQPRSRWEEALETFEGTRVDYQRIRGLARVLTDAATFAPRECPLAPRELRALLFSRGPVFEHPDIFRPLTREDLLIQVAGELSLTPAEVEQALFSDHPGAHLLVNVGPAWTPQKLLQRYNLELARGALYRATEVRIEIYDHYKDCWRFLKLFKIMFEAREIEGGGYEVMLTGPLSDFVETERYGIAFAEFMPAVLLGERWNLQARVRHPYARSGSERSGSMIAEDSSLLYRLDQNCGLQSHYRQGRTYDSALERNFASEFTDFEEKFGSERGKWRLAREDQVLVLDGSVMIPDFSLTHSQDEQRRILIELVGYWSPRYLKTKIAKVRAAQCPNLLLLVYENLKVTRDDFGNIPGEIIFFKEKPVIKEIMAAVEALAEKVYGQLPPPEKELPPLPLAELIERCLLAQADSAPEWYTLTALTELFQRHEPAFAPRRYGYRTLAALLKAHTELCEVRKGSGKGHPLEARLKPPSNA
jgi:predicted nuclease of restriction endonuclease-like RecB superfamily